MKGWVYILRSERNGRYYVGSTEDVKRRLNEFHNTGKVKATKHMRPLAIVFQQEFSDITEARKMEYKIKKKEIPIDN